MRHFLLVTADRRAMHPFDLKEVTGRTRIGMMRPNAALSRHELELDEPTYLKHAKAIALACRIPGNTVYILSVREDGIMAVEHPVKIPVAVDVTDPFEEQSATRIPAAEALPLVDEEMKFGPLQKIAFAEGVDQWKSFTSRKALCAAILRHRAKDAKPAKELHEAFAA